LLVNAAVCGVLSTPHDRYQSRVIWLLPFVAVLLHGGRSARGKLLARPAFENTPELPLTER
jgi:hypothetical protein